MLTTTTTRWENDSQNMDHLKATFLLLLISAIHAVYGSHDDVTVTPKCRPDRDVCDFSLHVASTVSMLTSSTSPDDVRNALRRPLVIFRNGSRAVRRDRCDDVTFLDPSEDADDVITLDGTYRPILTVNNTVPGPAIVVYEGQQVVVNVTNGLLGQSLTIHWHGQHQMNSPWMDGTAGVSQCPIDPGETFCYRFVAHPTGTFWYHSHEGVQRSEGVFGAFIVLPRPGSTQDKAEKQFYPNFAGDFAMTVQELYRQSSLEVYHQWAYDIGRYSQGRYDDLNSCYDGRLNVDGFQNSFVAPKSILIQGKGWHFEANSTDPENRGLPLTRYHVRKGQQYRFRVINVGLALTLRVSVDGHMIKVIGTDGHGVKPRSVESVMIAPGERYDVWLHATDPDGVGLYWIRVEGIEWTSSEGKRVLPIHGEAVLQYTRDDSSSTDSTIMPTSSRRRCSASEPCTILNCPYGSYPSKEHIICLPVTSLEPVIPEPPLTSPNDDVIEKFLHLHYAGSEPPTYRRISSINSKQFTRPSSPPQIFAPDTTWSPRDGVLDFDEPCTQSVCPGTHVLSVPTGRVLQLVLFVMAHREPHHHPSTHPIHLHGHSFQVIKIGHPAYDSQTGALNSGSKDLRCPDGETCGRAVWANESWRGGTVPGVSQDVVRKDTVAVPVGGYVVIRLETTNPGYWYLHCHMEFHAAQGMALIVKEGDVAQMPAPPKDFKKCGDFYWSEKEFEEKAKYKTKDSFVADQLNQRQYHIISSPLSKVTGEALQIALGLTLTLLLAAMLICVVLYVKLRQAHKGYTRLQTEERANGVATSFID